MGGVKGWDAGGGGGRVGAWQEAKQGTTTLGRFVESGGLRGVNLIISSCQKPGSDTA